MLLHLRAKEIVVVWVCKPSPEIVPRLWTSICPQIFKAFRQSIVPEYSQWGLVYTSVPYLLHNLANHPNLTQVMLASKEASSISLASNFLNQATEIQDKYDVYKNKEKLKMKVTELLRVFNANKKVDALSSNVMEL